MNGQRPHAICTGASLVTIFTVAFLNTERTKVAFVLPKAQRGLEASIGFAWPSSQTFPQTCFAYLKKDLPWSQKQALTQNKVQNHE